MKNLHRPHLMKAILTAITLFMMLISHAQQGNDWLETKMHHENGIINTDSLIAHIEDSLEMTLVYSTTVLNKAQEIQLNASYSSVKTLLSQVFTGQDLQYLTKNNKLFVSIKQTPLKYSQTKMITIEGRIMDEKSKESISFATIRYKTRAKGSIANENGVFKMLIPEAYKYDTLEISSLGYELKHITPAHFNKHTAIDIPLKRHLVKISEVTITPPNPKAILDAALSKIQNNYPQKPHYLNAYYRELIKEDSTFIKFCDAACQIHYDGYNSQTSPEKRMDRWDWNTGIGKISIDYSYLHSPTPYTADQVKILECRASENHQKIINDSLNTEFNTRSSINGGPIGLSTIDVAKTWPKFLDKKRYKNYKFAIKGKIKYRDKEAYHFVFTPKKNNRQIYEGEFYVDIESQAFIAFRYSRKVDTNTNNLKAEVVLISMFNKERYKKTKIKEIKRSIYESAQNIEIDYIPFDGKWYLNRIKHHNTILNRGDVWKDISFETSRELFVNSIDTQNILPFTKKEVYRSSAYNELFSYPYEYNPDFWENYDAIVATGVFGSALSDLNANKPLHQQFKDKVESNPNMPSPIALKKEHKTIMHKDTLVDYYQYLASKDDIDVALHLKNEANYTDNYLKKIKKSQYDIFYEMMNRVEKNSKTIPIKRDSFYYYTAYNDSAKYAFFYRKYDSINATPQLILDENKMGKGYAYYSIEAVEISPNQNLIAFNENTSGSFENTVRFKNIQNNTLLKDSISNVASIVWANDSTLYYTKMDSSYRSASVHCYYLGQKTQSKAPIYEETDSTFFIDINQSLDKKYVFIKSSSSNENEMHYIAMHSKKHEIKLIQKRQANLMYYASVSNDTFYIYSNKGSEYFSLYTTNPEKPQSRHWKALYEYTNNDVRLTNFSIKPQHIALEEIENMHSEIKVVNRNNNSSYYINIPKNYHEIFIRNNPGLSTDSIEYIAVSYNYPARIYRMHCNTKKQRIVKTEKVLGEYNPNHYVTKRIFAIADDATQIPITLCYNKKWKANEYEKGKYVRSERKLLMRGYGAYGIGSYPSFNPSDLSLLDRGYTIAYAHVRGGDEMGISWYKQGKMLNKKNTFTDFKACMDELIEQKYTTKGKIVAEGGSAGGMLMGVLANDYPDYFKTLILRVPFTDVLNTMLNENLPLTTGEFKEWGNPKRKKYYDYIKSYDPYQNIKAQDYPNMLFITYASDPNAPFYQAAKTVAKIREYKTDKNTQLLKCYTTGGHQGTSGRWEGLRNKAMVIAFIEYEQTKN